MYSDLFQHCTANTTLLTVNRRLTHYLQQQYATFQQQRGIETWVSLDILPLSSWYKRCWQTAMMSGKTACRYLLSEQQALRIWQTIIEQSEYASTVLSTYHTAQQAYLAWKLLQQWQLTFSNQASLSIDAQVFLQWQAAYKKICQQNNYLDETRIPKIIIELVNEKVLTLADNFYLLGFDELTPQQKTLIDSLKHQGHECTYIETNARPSQAYQLSFANQEQEIDAMIDWAHQTHAQSQATIACIIPELTTLRHSLQYKLQRRFYPEAILPANHQPNKLYNIASGDYLAQFPIINGALQCLQLFAKTIPLNIISSILRSPFTAAAEDEYFARCQLDKVLREENYYELNLQQLIAEASLPKRGRRIAASYCPSLVSVLQNLATIANDCNNFASVWANHFKHCLSILGWPGQRSLNSEETQCVERFIELLNEFSRFDTIEPALNYTTALQLLTDLTHNTLFQAKSEDTPIQIMGVLEAAGQFYDYIWVVGLHDTVWPPQAQPNPFIPGNLQSKLAMPHSSPERELHFCQTIMQRLQYSTNTIIYSYPLQQGDTPLRPSPLLQRLAEYPLIIDASASLTTMLFNSVTLETIYDDYALPIPEHTSVAGGTGLFRDQAACPFRSFAHYRLVAEGITQPELGLTAQDKGIIVHRILQLIWSELGDQTALLDLSAQEESALISLCIKSALQNYPELAPRFRLLEQRRLLNLIQNWLALEKERPYFRVIAREQWCNVDFGNIKLRMQIDRIDQLADGKYLLIDYKTGKTKIEQWFDQRLDEPQLPLYAITSQTPIDAITFAQVRTTDYAWTGISRKQIDIEGIEPLEKDNDWDLMLQQWRQSLLLLAQEFQQGFALIAPKKHEETCQYCDLQSLCRIYEKHA